MEDRVTWRAPWHHDDGGAPWPHSGSSYQLTGTNCRNLTGINCRNESDDDCGLVELCCWEGGGPGASTSAPGLRGACARAGSQWGLPSVAQPGQPHLNLDVYLNLYT